MNREHRIARQLLPTTIALIALACAACDRTPANAGAAMPPVEDTAKEIAPKIAIQYPTALPPELAALDQAMRSYAEGVQKKFDADVAARSDGGAAVPPQLNLEFTVATRTQDFVSAQASGEASVGDASAQPLAATFTEHLPSAKIIALSDLFVDSTAALSALSAEAKRRLAADAEARLRQENLADAQFNERLKTMYAAVEKGTRPDPQNFSSFLIDGVDGKAIGLSLQFQPGQVSNAALGAQQLEVPAKIFYMLLKPEYRDAFAVDKEDIKTTEQTPGAAN